MTTELNHDDIRWRVSNTWDKGDTKMGMLVGYIDSRTAMEALDALDPSWSTKMEPVSLGGEQGIRCTLIVNGVAREDVGVASNTEPLKGAFSDALKRAAVHFGVGRELYELPKIAVECEVDTRTGKAKAPKALPRYTNGRWSIDRQYGWVKYDREPEDQPERGARGGQPSSPSGVASPAPVQRTPEEQELLDELLVVPGMTKARLSLLADAVGVPKGERASADQLRAMLVRTIDTPQSEDSPAARAGSDAATVPGSEDGGSPPATSSGSGPAPTFDDVLAASGGELIPPKPGTDPYRALPAQEKAEARAYWQKAEVTA